MAGPNTSQAVFRDTGACRPATSGAAVATYPLNNTTDYSSGNAILNDGIYCFYIQAAGVFTTGPPTVPASPSWWTWAHPTAAVPVVRSA